MDLGQVFGRWGIGRGFDLRRFGVSQDGAEQIIEVMGNARGQDYEALQFPGGQVRRAEDQIARYRWTRREYQADGFRACSRVDHVEIGSLYVVSLR